MAAVVCAWAAAEHKNADVSTVNEWRRRGMKHSHFRPFFRTLRYSGMAQYRKWRQSWQAKGSGNTGFLKPVCLKPCDCLMSKEHLRGQYRAKISVCDRCQRRSSAVV